VQDDRYGRMRGPNYTRPYPQILWMIATLAVVATLCWWLQDALLQIVLANRWLNSLIIAVFALGAAVAIWQAVRLAPAQAWAERFAIGREGLERPPQLLASMSALLAAPEHRSGFAPTTTSTIVDSVNGRVSEGRDLTRYLGGLLIFLGLLGTFWGLARTVPALIETIRALTPDENLAGGAAFEQLAGGFEAQLRAMGTAFSSSLLGLAGSLVVGLLDLLGGQAQSRFLREFENWTASRTRLDGRPDSGVGSAAVHESLARNAELMDQMLVTLRGIAGVQAEAAKLRLRALERHVEALARSPAADAKLAASLREELAGLRRELAEAAGPRTQGRP